MDIRVVSSDTYKKNAVRIVFDSSLESSRFEVTKKEKILKIKVEKKKLTQRKLVLLFRQVVREVKNYRIKDIFIEWDNITSFVPDWDNEQLSDIMVTNFLMANYKFITYKEKPKEGWGFIESVYIAVSLDVKKDVEKGVRRGEIVGKQVNDCRDLSNTPGGDMTPTLFEGYIKKAIRGKKIKLKTLNVKEMRSLGMGGVLGVAQGSKEVPKFFILEYEGDAKKKPTVLIGKGVTFDSGGLDIKPSPYGVDMYLDMSGAAAVLHAILASERLGIKKNIVSLIPAVENMPSGESYRPGDVLRSMSGKTIEVLNTDAEGRIILADALTYAEKYDPEEVVDVATLTGAALVALGTRASAIFSPNEAFQEKLRELGEESGDYVWPLPLWEEFEADIQGNYADVANMQTKGSPREGGTIAAAAFLYQFAKSFKKWAHIDMASRMTASYDEFLEKGAAGAPVRLLIKLLETK